MAISPVVTQCTLNGSKEGNKDHEGESSMSILALDDSKIAQKVKKVIQKARIGPRKEDQYVLEGMTPFMSRIVKTEIPSKFKLPELGQYDGMGDPINHIS